MIVFFVFLVANAEGATGNTPPPIYDTIKDDHSSSGGGASRYSGASDRYNPTTFKNATGSSFGNYSNGGLSHDYDTPEGGENSRNTVTINGIAV